MVRYDVVVVGGGPAGAVAARAAARAGAKVLLLERAPRRPPRCTGLVGPALLDLLGLPRHLVLREVRALRICGPGGVTVEVEAPAPRGFVLDRLGLDRLLLARAQEAGAGLWAPAAAQGLEGGVLRTTVGPVRFEVLVGADGPGSAVRRWAGLPAPGELLVGAQAEVAGPDLGDGVEVWVGRSLAPAGFAWAVPAEEGLTRVGLLTSAGREAGSLLGRYLGRRFPGAGIRRREAGLVPVGPPPRTVGGRVLLVGDAAAQTKPLTGGGLLFGTIAARVAGERAARGLEALRDYEAEWRRALGREIAFGLRARQAFLGLGDEELSRVVAALAHPELQPLVAEEGDVDAPSRLARALLRRPGAWGAVLPLLRTVGTLRALFSSGPYLPGDDGFR